MPVRKISRRAFLARTGLGGAALTALGCGSPSPEGGRVTPLRGMVASSQTDASKAGVEILRQGGNAADAAVATAAALNVTEPTSTGVGGDMFALYYDASTRKITALNGSGRAPAGLSIDLLRKQGMRRVSPYHAHMVTVPGACAGWCDLVERHGTMPLSRIFSPAIRLAEGGFAVKPVTAHSWGGQARRLRAVANGAELLVDGRAPKAGEMFRNPGLARTFRAVADGGKEAYYRGGIARDLVKVLGGAGSVMTPADLAAHESSWDEPISTVYRGVRVWECPPNGQGITALLALNILEGFELKGQDPLGADRWHLMIEAMRLAFADTRWYVADPRVTDVPIAGLLSKDYAAKRRALIDPKKASADARKGSPVAGSDTVYFCVVDGQGNACSFINSNYMGFGTGLVPKGWGFTLQNRGYCFRFDPRHPNALAPGKRPYHTIIPGMMTRPDGSLYAPFGVMGGFMQPQGHVQVAVGLLDDGAAPQAALDRARFCIEPDSRGSRVHLEEGLPEGAVKVLEGRGHAVRSGVSGFSRSIFGRGQIIRPRADGSLEGGSDPRADGCALGV